MNENGKEMSKDELKQYVRDASNTVDHMLDQHPGIDIPVDPEIADTMGAFMETALEADDLGGDSDE